MKISSHSFYGCLALICASIMALQILQSRLFSVVTWYHLSFLVISIAMFGLTLGALKIYKGDEKFQRDNLGLLSAKACHSFGAMIVISLIVQLLVPIVHTKIISIIITLPLVTVPTAMAYYYAGQVITLCLTRSNRPIGILYGVDLIGAAAGCLIALWLMNNVDTPSGILLIAGIIMLTGLFFHASEPGTNITILNRKKFILPAVALLALGIFNTSLDNPAISPMWTKGKLLLPNEINHEEWNAISRVTVTDNPDHRSVFLWGASPKLPENMSVDYQMLTIDGDAGTPITKFDGKSWDQLKYLEYDVTNIAYALPNLKSAAIIGVGGGRDLMSAQYFGLDNITALDINATQIGLLTTNPEYRAYTNLADHPGTHIINSEARSWLTRSPEKFDIIQMSMIDTWAAAGAGAFALSENSLYTTDAFKIFLNQLNPNGVLTVSRWYSPTITSDIGRLTSMAVQILLDQGATEPSKHIFIANAQNVSTFILARDPLTPAQLTALHKRAKQYDYKIIAAPDMPPDNSVTAAIYSATTPEALKAAYKDQPLDLSPATDMRPFFFNQAHVTQPIEVIKQALSLSMQLNNAAGHAVATLNLYLIIILSLILAADLLIPPLKIIKGQINKNFLWAGSAYFSMIGIGFMFIEITLMQIMSMYLGHPVYGLGIVLFSLILSTGIGSLISEYLPLNNRPRIITWGLALCAYVIFLAFNIQHILDSSVTSDLTSRAVICLAMIFPCGALLGYGFPTGIRLVNQTSSRMTTWFWAVNGAAGVVASALAILISIGWGLDTTLIIAGVTYALIIIPALKMQRMGHAS